MRNQTNAVQTTSASHFMGQNQQGVRVGALPAPGVSQPVQAVQLIVSQLQVVISNERRLFLESHKPRPLLQHLQ